mgnify:CR=1 FL=1|jgi:hypothetical protein
MKKLVILLLILVGLGAAWYFGSPLVINKTVNEALPFENMTLEQFDDMVESVEEIDLELPTIEEMRELTEHGVSELEQEMVQLMEKMPDTVIEESMNSNPVLIASGMFEDADNFHKGSGTANVYDLTDDGGLLRLEDFNVTNGPDLRVLLVKSTDGNLDDGYIELAKLKGNKGDQNYDIASDINLDDYNSVVIYCKPFHVTFSTASLK